MSKNLRSQSHYLKVLLENNKEINKYIFRHINHKLLKAIVEIVYNVWKLPLKKENTLYLEKNFKILRRFIKARKERKSLLRRHYLLFSNLLHIVKKYIISILEENE